MSDRHRIVALLAAFALLPAAPASADGEVQITHAKALAGNVTPGDSAGYPVTISTQGSFKLASNLFVAANEIGIQVTKENVSIDLNGFTLEGSDVAWYGITGSGDNVSIRNGTIERFRFDGINISGDLLTLRDVHVLRNRRDGVQALSSDFMTVRDSVVVGNGIGIAGNGIICGLACTVEGTIVANNNGYGISLSSGTVLGSTIVENDNSGIISGGRVGYGHNTLYGNNLDVDNVSGVNVLQMQPNHCFPGYPDCT